MTQTTIHTVELGLLYEEQGYYEKAREHYCEVLRSDPENKLIMAALDRVLALSCHDMSRLSSLIDRWVTLLFLKRRMNLLGLAKRSH